MRSKGIHFLLITVISSIIVVCYKPNQQPFSGDPAYLTYMAQAIARGEPVYQTTTFGYPPFGPLISAASMHLGRWFGLESYLAPRYLSILILALSSGFLYLVTRRITGRAWAGAVAAFALMSFQLLIVRGTSDLEPKILVQFLTLIALLAIQSRCWWLVGMTLGMASLTYQPAFLIAAVAFFLCLLNSGHRRHMAVFHFIGGLILGSLPAVIYLLWTGQGVEFFERVVLFRLIPHPHFFKPSLIRLLIVSARAVGWKGVPFALLSVYGFFWHMTQSLRKGRIRSYPKLYFSELRMSGIDVLTLIFLLMIMATSFSPISSFGSGDFLSFFHVIAFWASWGIIQIYEAIVRFIKTERFVLHKHSAASIISSSLIAVLVVYALIGAFRYKFSETLSEQKAWVQSVLSKDEVKASFLAINAEEFYVLSEKSAPWPYLRFIGYHDNLIRKIEKKGCLSLLEDLDVHSFKAIIIKLYKSGNSSCLEEIIAKLRLSYNETTIKNYLVFSQH